MDRIKPMGQLEPCNALSLRSIRCTREVIHLLQSAFYEYYAVSHGKMVGTSNYCLRIISSSSAVSHGKMVGTSNLNITFEF